MCAEKNIVLLAHVFTFNSISIIESGDCHIHIEYDNLLITGVYIKPKERDKVILQLKQISTTKDHILIGDFNSNMTNHKSAKAVMGESYFSLNAMTCNDSRTFYRERKDGTLFTSAIDGVWANLSSPSRLNLHISTMNYSISSDHSLISVHISDTVSSCN